MIEEFMAAERVVYSQEEKTRRREMMRREADKEHSNPRSSWVFLRT
jgi:hypothetical protein